MPDLSTTVVVIGGGSTGAGVLRDLALRGIAAILIEKGDLASGTTGRSHGLLHSGARYAVTDEQTARDCALEGKILRTIAANAIEDTGGFFISVTEQDEAWEPLFAAGCRRAGIAYERMTVGEARRREPELAAQVRSVFWVPGDARLDPHRLVLNNVESARRRGARILTHTEMFGFLRNSSRVNGVRVRDSATGEEGALGCQAVINAAGPWAGRVARLLDIEIDVVPVKGIMAVLSGRLVKTAISRCHRPGDGDIIVPASNETVLGTTAERVTDPEATTVEWSEVTRLIQEGAKMLRSVGPNRVLRAYAGVRPIYDPARMHEGRAVSRNFAVIDHEARDGVAGFTSVVGGKLTTYRLMAEHAVDLVAQRLGVPGECTTAQVPLDEIGDFGSEPSDAAGRGS